MIILGLSTSSKLASVALSNEQDILIENSTQVQAGHGAGLLPLIEKVCLEAKITPSQIDAYAVDLGPGTFTGLRVGLATIKGMALAQNKPIVGVLSLEALALNIERTDGLVVPLIDAKCGEVYAAAYNGLIMHTYIKSAEEIPAGLYSPEEITALVTEIGRPVHFVGSGAIEYHELCAHAGSNQTFSANDARNNIQARHVIKVAISRLNKGENSDINTLVPQYMRATFAESKNNKSK